MTSILNFLRGFMQGIFNAILTPGIFIAMLTVLVATLGAIGFAIFVAFWGNITGYLGTVSGGTIPAGSPFATLNLGILAMKIYNVIDSVLPLTLYLVLVSALFWLMVAANIIRLVRKVVGYLAPTGVGNNG